MGNSFMYEWGPFEAEYEIWNETGEWNPEFFEEEWEGEVARNSPEFVRWVQDSLNRVMGLRLAVDGIMGPMTRSAVRSFQQRRGLMVDGVVGPMTENALRSALGPSSPNTVAPLPRQIWILDGFDFAKSNLKPEHISEINAIAEFVKASLNTPNPVRAIDLVGHTDPVGTDADNYKLGCLRAWSATKALRDRLGWQLVNHLSFRVASMGEKQPVAGNDAASRRVEIDLHYGSVPSLSQQAVRCDQPGANPPSGQPPGSKLPDPGKGNITVQVTRADNGRPIPGIQISIRRVPPSGWAPPWVVGETDNNGYSDLGPLEPGRYAVTAHCLPRYTPDAEQQVTVNAGTRQSVKFACYPKEVSWVDKVDWDEKFSRNYNEICSSINMQRAACGLLPSYRLPMDWASCQLALRINPETPCCLSSDQIENKLNAEVCVRVHNEIVREFKIDPGPVVQAKYAEWKQRVRNNRYCV